jgi:Mn-dependent DtxR family transcriptional regulator
MTRQEQVLEAITSFNEQGIGVTRQTLAGALTQPINTVTARVRELILAGLVAEDGVKVVDGRQRRLLWADNA